MSGSSFFPRPLCHSRHYGRSKNPEEHNTRAGLKYKVSFWKDDNMIFVRDVWVKKNLSQIISKPICKWYKPQTIKKISLNSQFQTVQILTNDAHILILCLSYMFFWYCNALKNLHGKSRSRLTSFKYNII